MKRNRTINVYSSCLVARRLTRKEVYRGEKGIEKMNEHNNSDCESRIKHGKRKRVCSTCTGEIVNVWVI